MLTQNKIQHILNIDIPYSIGIMNAHSRSTVKAWYGDKHVLNAMFVGSLIKGRLFLELLGLKLEDKKLALKHKSSDISIEALGGTRVSLEELSSDQTETLRKFLISTNKHEAHLTSQEHDGLDHIKPGFELINILLKTHLPSINNSIN